MMRTYIRKYVYTALSVPDSTRLPSSWMRVTRRGCIIRRTSDAADLTSMIKRDTFRPPPVLPAQAPTNISISSTHCVNCGHCV